MLKKMLKKTKKRLIKRRGKKTKTKKRFMKYRRVYRKKIGGEDDPVCDYKSSEKIWPTNFGCELNEVEKEIIIKKGTILDRFGHNYGYYFGDPSSSFDERSLTLIKPNKECEPLYKKRVADSTIVYRAYRVEKEFKVKECNIAPAFRHNGQGVQYRLFEGSLTENNLLFPIKPKRDQSDAKGNKVERDMYVPNVQELIDNQYISLIPANTIPDFE